MRNLVLSILSLVLVVGGFSSAVQALTLAEKKKLADWNEAISGSDSYAGWFERDCGYKLPVTLDESLVTPFMEENTSAYAYCDEVVSSMQSMCAAEAIYKEAIAGAVKALNCTYEAGDEPQFSISEDGTLNFKTAPGQGNLGSKTKEYLENNL